MKFHVIHTNFKAFENIFENVPAKIGNAGRNLLNKSRAAFQYKDAVLLCRLTLTRVLNTACKSPLAFFQS